jgi:hypothetical protein
MSWITKRWWISHTLKKEGSTLQPLKEARDLKKGELQQVGRKVRNCSLKQSQSPKVQKMLV